MGHLVTKARNSGKISYSGTQYVNPINGTKRLCIRTGTKPNDIIKYGLTTNSSASEYCGMRMKIDGNTAYIGRKGLTSEISYTTIQTKKHSYSSSVKSYNSNTKTASTIHSTKTYGANSTTYKSLRSYTTSITSTIIGESNNEQIITDSYSVIVYSQISNLSSTEAFPSTLTYLYSYTFSCTISRESHSVYYGNNNHNINL